MARIKIKDLPRKMKITKAELESIRGGLFSPRLPNLRLALGQAVYRDKDPRDEVGHGSG